MDYRISKAYIFSDQPNKLMSSLEIVKYNNLQNVMLEDI